MSLIPLFTSFAIIFSGLTCLMLSTQGMFINRTFLNMPLTVIENSVKDKNKSENLNLSIIKYDDLLTFALEEREEKNFYFDREELKNNVNNYLISNLKGKIDKYEIAFSFYDEEGGDFFETNVEDPTGVLIRFKCTYYRSFEIDTQISFYIVEKEIGDYE